MRVSAGRLERGFGRVGTAVYRLAALFLLGWRCFRPTLITSAGAGFGLVGGGFSPTLIRHRAQHLSLHLLARADLAVAVLVERRQQQGAVVELILAHQHALAVGHFKRQQRLALGRGDVGGARG
ncbi:hypothetical protein D3C87_1443840 [compost metagenome]